MHSIIPTSEGFLAASGTTLVRYDGSSATVLGTDPTYADPIQHAYHSDRVILVNGQMTPSVFESGSLTAMTITGVTDPQQFIGVTVFKSRAIYWKDSPGFYYSSAGGFQGALNFFDISTYTDGNVKFCFTYSTDAGDGTDDMFIVVMDSGQALMYQGNDPGDVANWELISTYTMPAPISIRGHCDFVGDQIILTEQGWLNFDHVVKNGNLPGGIGHKIVELARQALTNGTTPELWEAHYVSSKRLIVITTLQGGNYIYHVMNVLTGAWCTFSGFSSLVWAVSDGEGYYAEGSKIMQYGGYTESVTATAIPAYTQLGSDGLQRQVAALRPVTNINPSSIGLAAAKNFNDPPSPTCTLDSTAPDDIGGQWRSINGFAYNASYVMKTETSGHERRWYSTQILFNQGGPI